MFYSLGPEQLIGVPNSRRISRYAASAYHCRSLRTYLLGRAIELVILFSGFDEIREFFC